MTRKRKARSQINRDAFAETERDPVSRSEVESAVRQVLGHPAKPEKRSENREPSKAEINQRWKMRRT